MRSALRKRFISSIILAPAVIFGVVAGGLPTIALIAACAGLAVYEWNGIASRLPNYKSVFIGGLAYLLICFLSFIIIRFGFGEAGGFLLLSLLVSVWISDIGAYTFGKTIGGLKLVPTISPNKTWAGLFGASICCALALVSMNFLAMGLGSKFYYPYDTAVFVFGCFMGVIAQMGDLLVSIFKRKSGLKDTGSLIPGHGGILDRIDALLLAGTFFLSALLVAMP